MKKFLSVVMALAMTLTLVTVGASAKSFTDDSKITYAEAVQVISGIGVVDGYTDGSFNPTATLTRGAAAKIICNLMLGPTAASALGVTSAPFSDVPVTNVFAGYIAYCSSQGIINGYGDGTFKPTATVTGYQFMKMLLGALGYDGSIEGFTGSNWSVNVAKLAISVGLDKGNSTFLGSKAMTREEAALYAFNTLKADVVQYSSKGTSINVNGIEIVTGASDAAPITVTGESNAANYDTTGAKGVGYKQFCEVHFSALKSVSATTTTGETGHKWKAGTPVKDISDVYTSATVVATYYGETTGSELNNYTWFESTVPADTDVKISVNGAATNDMGTEVQTYVSKGSTHKFFSSYKGATINLVDTTGDGKVDRVNVTMPYLAKVTKVVAATSTKDAYAKLDVYNNGNATASTAYVYTDGFEKDEYVLYAPTANTLNGSSASPAEDYIVLTAAESFVSDVSSYNVTKGTFVASGTTYSYSSAAGNSIAVASLDVDNGSTYTFYLDANGTVIGSVAYDDAATALNVAYVKAATTKAADNDLINGTNDAIAKIQLVYMDGTIESMNYVVKTATSGNLTTLNANKATGETHTFIAGDAYLTVKESGTSKYIYIADETALDGYEGSLVVYSKDSDGAIAYVSDALTTTISTVTYTGVEVASSKNVAVVKGQPGVDFDAAGAHSLLYTTKDTVLTVLNGSTVTAYTGYSNFPTKTFTTASDLHVMYKTKDGVVTNILVVAKDVSIGSFDAYGAFVGLGDNTSDGQNYKFLVDGEIVSYLLQTGETAPTDAQAVYGISSDTNGKIALTPAANGNTAQTVSSVGDTYMVIGGTVVDFADDCVVYNVSNGTAAEWGTGDLGASDVITYTVNDSGDAVAIFITTDHSNSDTQTITLANTSGSSAVFTVDGTMYTVAASGSANVELYDGTYTVKVGSASNALTVAGSTATVTWNGSALS